ncbi:MULTISPECIES: sugar ABC transporter ATP-binding protein [Mesorhizobium]|uniref:sugar ABC transporter ATP-binding protein n=1 Tax=Mesorhizobium TaxID=68287 RepID=UPI001F343F57|nr:MULTISPECIES: sugar ABC transporter ATP-binding protein [Mesorhizobium]MCF6122889.1 sugar ABC transporter ATP-binding protein [Mesorhizobium ciceri]MCQ8813353.1 sugar ABC transporter ATP-binding protein [Mesorhizobium sp. SEMIA396]
MRFSTVKKSISSLSEVTAMNATPLVELKNLEKEFAGTKALKGVSLSFLRGEVHGLLGENGAGKSTLIKILTGVYAPSAGEIFLEGSPVRVSSPPEAHRLGLGAVYQDAELVSSFTVGQNILLGNEPGRIGISDRAIHDEAAEILSQMGIELDVRRLAGALSAAEMQLVTLATLFHRRYKLIVLDEPTARLSAAESEVLFRIVDGFKAQGIAIVYISHRLREVQQICDRATILRGGLVSGTLNRGEVTEDRVTELMVDRSRSELATYNDGNSVRPEVLVEVAGLGTAQLAPLSFKMQAGEVLGFTGPVGGGMEDVARALGGISRHSGTAKVRGKAVNLATPIAARRSGIALIPEDRRKQALFPALSAAENICLPVLHSLQHFLMIRPGTMKRYAEAVLDQLAVRPRASSTQVRFFSGGNQQKLVIGKWMSAKATVYIIVEPTNGVDVGAIKEIYDIILQLARDGAAVLLISSSLNEMLALADRIMVIHDGNCVAEAPKKSWTYDDLLAVTLSGKSRHTASPPHVTRSTEEESR